MGRARKHEHQLGDFWLGKRAGSSSWYVMWNDPKSGRVERLSTGTEDLEEAQRKLADHFLRKQRLRQRGPEEVTLVAVLKHYYDQHGHHVRSKDEIDRAIRYMAEFWPTEPVAAITIEEQERFVQHMRGRGLASGTIKRMAGVLGAALRRAYNTNQLVTVPATLRPAYFGPDVERQRILSLDEMKALWDARMPHHLRVYLVLSINTAARPEAILQLKSEQIDLERRLLGLNPPGRRQTKKYRPTLPISNTLLPWLDLERNYQVQYKKRQDRPIGSIKTTWREVRKRAGLDEDVIPYTIRHTIATELRRRGVPEWECRGFMGHRSGGVTERYAKFQPDHLGAAIKAIDAYCAELHAISRTPMVLGPPDTRQFDHPNTRHSVQDTRQLRASRKRASSKSLKSGRREWDRTTDPHHVKVVLYH